MGYEELGQEQAEGGTRDSRHHRLEQGREVPFDHGDKGQGGTLHGCFRVCSLGPLQSELQDLARRGDTGHGSGTGNCPRPR